MKGGGGRGIATVAAGPLKRQQQQQLQVRQRAWNVIYGPLNGSAPNSRINLPLSRVRKAER